MKTIKKALVGGGFAAVGTFGGLLADGKTSLAEVLIALGAGLTAAYATWKVTNEPA